MLHKEDVSRLLDYTVWANHRVMRGSATLSLEDFRRDLGSSHGGVRGTLAHIMGAEWIWLERWKGVSPDRGIDESEFPDLLALRERWTALEEHRRSWLQSVSEAHLAAPLAYRNVAGKEFTAPLWQLVQHVANHSTYHRGQVITLLRILGARGVTTDLVVWDREGEGARPPETEPPRS